MNFLPQVMGMKARRLGDETWRNEGDDRVIQEAGTKHLREYINRRQATVVKWVELQPILEVCTKETGYEGWGRLSEQWWIQTATEQQLKTRLKEISEAAWEQQ